MAFLFQKSKVKRDLISLNDFTCEEIDALLDRGEYWSEKANFRITNLSRVIDNPIVCNLFFESSTRTRFSFEVASRKLGYHVLNFDPDKSSTQKGETIYDTLRTLESMGANIAIIRTTEENLLQEVAPSLSMSIINAGAGANEHPTQGLLDLLTIRQQFNTIAGLKVAIIGDVKYSRVANSNMIALSKYNAEILLAGPQSLLPEHLMTMPNVQFTSVDQAVAEADVIMMLRVQRERHPLKQNFDWASEEGRRAYLEEFGLTAKRFAQAKPHAVIMHPAPFNRDVEIESSLIEDPRSLIFKQVHNGVAIRMAVLERAIV